MANIPIIAVYACTLDTFDDIKNDHPDAVDEITDSDILVVAGDWNARTGPADEFMRHLLGRFGLRNHCSNDERLLQFASAHSLVVSSIRFQNRYRGLETCSFNDGRTRNQIDYVLLRARWASSVLDCRSYRGADTGSAYNTEHALDCASIRLGLKANRQCQRSLRNDTTKIRKATGNGYRHLLQNRSVQLAEVTSEFCLESKWVMLKSSVLETAREHSDSQLLKRNIG